MDKVKKPTGFSLDKVKTLWFFWYKQILENDFFLPLSEAGDGYEHKFKIPAFREGWVWTQRDWTQATKDTGIGNPHRATPEKGQSCLQQVAAQIAGFLVDFAAVDVDDLYESR